MLGFLILAVLLFVDISKTVIKAFAEVSISSVYLLLFETKKNTKRAILLIGILCFIIVLVVNTTSGINSKKRSSDEATSVNLIENSDAYSEISNTEFVFDQKSYEIGQGYEAGYCYLSGIYPEAERNERYAKIRIVEHDFMDSGYDATIDYCYKNDELRSSTLAIQGFEGNDKSLIEKKMVNLLSEKYGNDYEEKTFEGGIYQYNWTVLGNSISLICYEDMIMCLVNSDDIEWMANCLSFTYL